MKITLKLFATLSEYLPSEAHGRSAEVDVPDGTSTYGALSAVAVPTRLAHIVMVNGRFLPAVERDRLPLHEGDEVAVWPAIGGG